MYAVYAAVVFAVGLLFFGVLVLTFRRPNPPAWTRNPTMEIAVAVGFTATCALAFSLLFEFLSNFKNQSFGAFEGTIVVGVLVAAAIIWKMLRMKERLAAYEAAKR